jgi:anhydro-N-acetylmuramic acid kinase
MADKSSGIIIGLMSGTSLDGLDIAACEFIENRHQQLSYEIICAETLPYSPEWRAKLIEAPGLKSESLLSLSVEYGKHIGELSKRFIEENGLAPVLISSHGHTVFHQPEKGFSLQIGHGAAIANSSGYPVVNDFRMQNIQSGGQGAPLVPAGDVLLFNAYDACLNLGGFSNITLIKQKLAFDISPCNIILNFLASQLGHAYDAGGEIAANGKLINELWEHWNTLEFYSKTGAKSLGQEWINYNILPSIEKTPYSLQDLLHTFTVHAAEQISRVINQHSLSSVLVSGGGAYNDFLMKEIQNRTQAKLVKPESELIEFKEALIFALLGWLRWNHQINTFSDFSGGTRNWSSGSVWLP